MLMRAETFLPSPAPRTSPYPAAGRERHLRRGATLRLSEGAATQVLRVLGGCLRVCHPLMDGRRQITSFLLAGDHLCLDELKDHHGSIEAVTAASVLLFDGSAACAEAGRDGVLWRDRLGALRAQLLLLGHKNAREKLAAFLLEMSHRLAGGADEFRLPMSRYDIAAYLCVTPETVCRNFSQLVADGLIAIEDTQTVRILHRPSLDFIGR